MNGYPHKSRRSLRKLSCTLSLIASVASALLLPYSASAEEPESLLWARIDYLRNRVQLVPRDQAGRQARISDVLSVGDSLRTARVSRAELRFNDGSLARVGERAIFRFTPNTRNFQLSNGTILLLIPPGRGRSTIQTPNATTGIQGSALFVRYIPETDTTIVGALTNNPDGPMVLFNRDGTEQQALRANEIGVIQGDQIIELYEFDGTLFWQSSGLAEGFNYLSDTSSSSNPDQLDGVRQEIREAISNQSRLSGEAVITNPETFSAPAGATDLIEDSEPAEVEFPTSVSEEFLESDAETTDGTALGIGVNNSLSASNSEDGISEDGISEDGTLEDGTLEDGTLEDGTLEDGTLEDGTSEDAESLEGSAANVPSDDSQSGSNSSGGASGGVSGSEGQDGTSPGSGTSDSAISGTDANGTDPNATGPIETGNTAGSDSAGPDSAGLGSAGSGIDGSTPGGLGDQTNDASGNTPSINSIDSPGSGAAGPSNGGSLSVPSVDADEGMGLESNVGGDSIDTTIGSTGANNLVSTPVGENGTPTAAIAQGAVSQPEVVIQIDAQTVDVRPVDVRPTGSQVGAPRLAPAALLTVGSELPSPGAAPIAHELVTIPEGNTPLIQLVPDTVEKLDEVQTVHDLEMHDPVDSMSGNALP